jgi:hypothetical protein
MTIFNGADRRARAGRGWPYGWLAAPVVAAASRKAVAREIRLDDAGPMPGFLPVPE